MKGLDTRVGGRTTRAGEKLKQEQPGFGTRNISRQFQHGTNSFPVWECGKTIAPTTHPLAVQFRHTHKRIYRQPNSSRKTG
jgi:hypothetical protein